MKTYVVLEAHKKTTLFTGKRTEVKKYINNNGDPMKFDVASFMSNGCIGPKRVWGGDFIETGYRF